MKVLFDSNIVIEAYDDKRPLTHEAKFLMQDVVEHKFKGYLTAASFYTIIYYAEIRLKKLGYEKSERIQMLREYLRTLLKTFTIVEQGNKQLERAILNPEFLDLEDSCQYQAALKAGCDYLVTINTKDFHDCTGKTAVLHPVDFVKVLDEQEKQDDVIRTVRT